MKAILFAPILFLISCSQPSNSTNTNISNSFDSLTKKDASQPAKPIKISDDMILGFKFEMTKKDFEDNLKKINAKTFIGAHDQKMFRAIVNNGKYSAPAEVSFHFNKKGGLNNLFFNIYASNLPLEVQQRSASTIEVDYAEFIAKTQNIPYNTWQDPKNEVLDSYFWDDDDKRHIIVNVFDALIATKRNYIIGFSDRTFDEEMTWLKK